MRKTLALALAAPLALLGWTAAAAANPPEHPTVHPVEHPAGDHHDGEKGDHHEAEKPGH